MVIDPPATAEALAQAGPDRPGLDYFASEKDWAVPNLFTRVYTRLKVVWIPITSLSV